MSEYIVEMPKEPAKVVRDGWNVRIEWQYKQREEIVRCRNCKYHELMVVSYLDKPLSVCTAEWCVGAEGDNPLVKPDGFCAWGEIKERIEQ